MKTLSFFSSLSLLICGLIFTSNAHARREHKAHTHGAAKLDISIENNEIEANLEIPGTDLVGFEGAPKTAKQKEDLKRMTDLMTKEYSLFMIDEAAGCKVTERKLETDNHEKTHTEYNYEIEYKCKDASKVKVLDVNIFRDIETLNEVTVQLVTQRSQKQVKLTRTSSKVEL